MPASDQGAALQFFVEAMKANTATLERLGKENTTTLESIRQSLVGLQAEQRETVKLLHDTRERVIRIESAGQAEHIGELKDEVAALKKEVAHLKSDRDHREGAIASLNWGLKYGPVLIAAMIAIILTLRATGQI